MKSRHLSVAIALILCLAALASLTSSAAAGKAMPTITATDWTYTPDGPGHKVSVVVNWTDAHPAAIGLQAYTTGSMPYMARVEAPKGQAAKYEQNFVASWDLLPAQFITSQNVSFRVFLLDKNGQEIVAITTATLDVVWGTAKSQP